MHKFFKIYINYLNIMKCSNKKKTKLNKKNRLISRNRKIEEKRQRRHSNFFRESPCICCSRLRATFIVVHSEIT